MVGATVDEAEELTAHRVLVEEWRSARDGELRAVTSRARGLLEAEGHGPRYYPVDAAYRIRVALETSPDGARVKRERVTGEEDDHPLVGFVRGSVGGRPFALEATRTLAGKINVAFRDATCGAESYGFRYVAVEQDERGEWWLDFNLAHNPLCAYGEGFRCILPPPGNALDTAIRAGERRFR